MSADLAALFQSEAPPPVLFAFAHPDDELFCAGLLQRLLHAGARLKLLWATSGETCGGGSVREAELECAMSALGVAPEDRVLLRMPCRGLAGLQRQLVDRLAEAVQAHQPTVAVVPAWEGGHPDHDALNLAMHRALGDCRDRVCQLEYPLYSRTGPWWALRWRVGSYPPGPDRGLPLRLRPQEVRLRRRMARCHQSQKKDMLPFLAAMELRHATGRGEVYRTVPPERNYSLPPHSGNLNYEGGLLAPRLMDFTTFRRAVSESFSE